MEIVPLRILIVEDHEDTRLMLQLSLKLAGYEVVAASSRSQALELASEKSFDLCVLDHRRSEVIGANIRKQLRGLASAMPALFCSGIPFKADRIESLRHNGDGYLLKPVDTHTIRENVALLLKPKE